MKILRINEKVNFASGVARYLAPGVRNIFTPSSTKAAKFEAKSRRKKKVRS